MDADSDPAPLELRSLQSMDAMSYSLLRFVWIPLLLTLTPTLAACQEKVESCESRLEANYVLRVDKTASRLFVLSSESEITDAGRLAGVIRRLDATVAACKLPWSDNWHASFFSVAESAGYKGEEQIAPRVASGRWAQEYLAEFTNLTRSVELFPAYPSRQKAVRMK